MGEIKYVYDVLEEQAADLRELASTIRNYRYDIELLTSNGAHATQVQQAMDLLSDIGEAIARLTDATAIVVMSAAQEMRSAEDSTTITIYHV